MILPFRGNDSFARAAVPSNTGHQKGKGRGKKRRVEERILALRGERGRGFRHAATSSRMNGGGRKRKKKENKEREPPGLDVLNGDLILPSPLSGRRRVLSGVARGKGGGRKEEKKEKEKERRSLRLSSRHPC